MKSYVMTLLVVGCSLLLPFSETWARPCCCHTGKAVKPSKIELARQFCHGKEYLESATLFGIQCKIMIRNPSKKLGIQYCGSDRGHIISYMRDVDPTTAYTCL